MSAASPRVYVGPREVPELIAAVEAGGGTVVPLERAEALVYFGSDEPSELAGLIHPGIRWVQLPHAGVEPWTEAGVITADPVFSCAAGIYGFQVAEHALALMLAGSRMLHVHARASAWGTKNTRVFAGSTVALIGMGGIGRALVGLLRPFGVRLIAVSDSAPVDGVDETLPRAEYRAALAEADYVVLAAPSTPETHHMIGAAELASMREGAWLINVARGELVDTEALLEALDGGRLGGAALDVTEPEPLPAGHPLWSHERVLITPHVANPAEAYWQGLGQRTRENVRAFEPGADAARLRELLLGVVEPGRGY